MRSSISLLVADKLQPGDSEDQGQNGQRDTDFALPLKQGNSPRRTAEGSEASAGRIDRGKHAEHIEVLTHVPVTRSDSHGDPSWTANLLVEEPYALMRARTGLWEPQAGNGPGPPGPPHPRAIRGTPIKPGQEKPKSFGLFSMAVPFSCGVGGDVEVTDARHNRL